MSVRNSLLLLIVVTASGCSLLLDPTNCESSAECAPGVCTSGVCVGPRAGETPDEGIDSDADADEAVASDADVPIEPDTMDAEIAEDGELPDVPDVLPDVPPALAPTCEILAPGPNDRLLDTTAVDIEVSVFDSDTPPEALVVTLNGEPVTLDGAGMATISLVLDEGSTAIALQAVDGSGLRCSDRISVTADTVAPAIELVLPARARSLTRVANFGVVGRVIDENRVETLVVTVDGDELADLDVEWDGDEFEFNVPLAQGENSIEISTVDAVGNEADPAAFVLELDDVPPPVSIDDPADGARTGAASISVDGVVTNDDPFFLSQVTITAQLVGERAHDTQRIRAAGGVFSANLRLLEGDNTIEACGDDPAGNVGCDTITVTRENQEPCVTIEAPDEGATVSGARIDVAGTVCPVVTSVEVTLPGGDAVQGVVADGRFTATATLPGPGRHTITATARTDNGSSATDTQDVVLDDSPPIVRISSPDPGACYNEGQLTVCGSARDAESAVTGLVASGGGFSEDGMVQNNGQFCISILVPEAADLEIVVTATNAAGLEGQATIVLDVDLTGPTFAYDVPIDGYVPVDGTGRVQIAGQVEVAGEICQVTTLTIEGRPQAILAGGRFNFRGEFADGPQAIALRATDAAGNVSTDNFSFRVDSAPPTLTNIVPAAALVTSEQITTISAKTCDGGSAIDEAGLTIGGIAVEAEPSNEAGCFNISRTVGVPEGVTEFDIVVRDQVGNRNTHTVVVSRDVTAPIVTVDYPAPNDSVESTFNAAGTITDGELGSGVNRVLVNGVEAELDAFVGTWRAVNIPAGGGGARQVEVVAFDNAANRTDPLMIPVTVDEFVLTDRDRKGFGGASETGWVGVFDVDGDTRLDIVALTSAVGGDSVVYTQDLDGTFTARGTAETGLPNAEISDAAVGDFNNDGLADIMIVGNNINGVWRGAVGAGFQQTAIQAAGLASTGLAVGDVNRDGTLDALIFAGNQSRMLFGNGAGGFDVEPLINLDIADATSFENGEFVDVTGDGVLDLLAIGPDGSRLWVGDRSGIFVTPTAIPDLAATASALIDVNRDGILDVFTAESGAGRFLLGNGATLGSPNAFGLTLAAGESALSVADIDGDTRDDVVVHGPAGFKLWRNDPIEGFVAIEAAASNIPALTNIRAAAVADIDLDGDFDIVGADIDGPFLIRANGTARRDGYRYVHLDVRRAQPLAAGPNDGFGVQVFQNLQGDEAAERVLVPAIYGPDLVTLGGAQQGNFTVRYVDKGAPGTNTRTIGPLESMSSTIVSGRE